MLHFQMLEWFLIKYIDRSLCSSLFVIIFLSYFDFLAALLKYSTLVVGSCSVHNHSRIEQEKENCFSNMMYLPRRLLANQQSVQIHPVCKAAGEYIHEAQRSPFLHDAGFRVSR